MRLIDLFPPPTIFISYFFGQISFFLLLDVCDRAVPSKTECRPCRCLLGNFNKGNLVFGIDPGYKNAESEIFKFFR